MHFQLGQFYMQKNVYTMEIEVSPNSCARMKREKSDGKRKRENVEEKSLK